MQAAAITMKEPVSVYCNNREVAENGTASKVFIPTDSMKQVYHDLYKRCENISNHISDLK